MPIETTLEDGVLSVTPSGAYTPAELRQSGGDAVLDAGREGRVRVLLDMSDTPVLRGRTMEELRETAAFFASLHPHLEAVAIVATEDLNFGLMRMSVAYFVSADVRARTFRSRDEALTWLRKAP